MLNSPSPKHRIKQQFLEELASTNYSKITVTSIAATLGMSRRNIYKHYSSKEEILLDIVQEKLELFFDIFENYYRNNSPDKWSHISHQILAVIVENRSLLYEVLRDDTHDLVFKRLKSSIMRALGHVARINHITINDRGFLEMYAGFMASASYEVTKTWIFSEEEVSPRKLSALYDELFNESIIKKLELCESPDRND